MPKLKVVVLFGGRSGEHEVSLVSARSVINALDKKKYEVKLIGIAKTGEWISGNNSLVFLESRNNKLSSGLHVDKAGNNHTNIILAAKTSIANYSAIDLALNKIDVVIPILHGPYGEDGTVQGLLETADIPYVGSGVLGSAVGMDKIVMKMIFQANNLPTCKFQWFLRTEWKKNKNIIVKNIEKDLGYPCFVKPANSGSSVGISKAHNKKELTVAINLAVKYDRRIIIEEGVNCREVECSVLGNDNPKASILAEIIPGKEFYDYEAKYTEGLSRAIIPTKLSRTIVKKIQDLSCKAFKVLDLAGMARVDFFIRKENNEILLNEVNTIPGFTNISMFPKLWQASGIKYSRLLDILIELALERYKENSPVIK